MAEDWLSRALAAWHRGSQSGQQRLYPADGMSVHVALPNGKEYVVIANSYHVLGVYRIRPSGFLRRMKKWPKAVEVAAGWTE
jgi:hypothetical protein